MLDLKNAESSSTYVNFLKNRCNLNRDCCAKSEIIVFVLIFVEYDSRVKMIFLYPFKTRGHLKINQPKKCAAQAPFPQKYNRKSWGFFFWQYSDAWDAEGIESWEDKKHRSTNARNCVIKFLLNSFLFLLVFLRIWKSIPHFIKLKNCHWKVTAVQKLLDQRCWRFSEGYLNNFSTELSSQIFNCCPRNFLIQEKQNGNVVSTSHWIRPVLYLAPNRPKCFFALLLFISVPWNLPRSVF